MATAEERLEELLQLKDAELEDAQERISALQRQLEYGVDWMLHERIDGDEDALPTPRLEMRIIENTDHYVESQVSMVIAQRGGSHSRVPLGYSKRSGSGVAVDEYPTEGKLPDVLIRDLPGLVNDLCFYNEQTKLPAYVVLDEERIYIVTSLRPLDMSAVERA